MLFRSHLYKSGAWKERYQNDLSARAGNLWNEMSAEEKAPWKAKAAEEKERHMRMYPGYSFTPGKKQSVEEVSVAPVVPKEKAKRRPASRSLAAPSASASSRSRARRAERASPVVMQDDAPASPSRPEDEVFPVPFYQPNLYLESQAHDEFEIRSDCGSASVSTWYPSA